MQRARLILAGVALSVAACALPFTSDDQLMDGAGSASDTAAVAPPVVEVREFPHSSVVSVLAWEADDAQLGLRTSVTRTGKLFGGLRAGDHQLYVSWFEARQLGGFKYATVTPGQLLLPLGTRRDPDACKYGRTCSPMLASAVRIPDSLLRAHRDSLVVTFHPYVQRDWSVTLRPELITAYLRRVDSVVAAQH